MKFLDHIIKDEKIINDLIKFTEVSVMKFLEEHKNFKFYAFAYDCNSEYAEVNLCFNTEEGFSKILKMYQEGEYKESYQSTESIYEIRYNTGDWSYQCFDTKFLFTEKEMTEIYENDIEKQTQDIMEICCKALLKFKYTEQYKNIPKTTDFKTLCLDHDEDIEVSEMRMEKITT